MNNDINEKAFPAEYSARRIYESAANFVKRTFEAGNIAVIYAKSVECAGERICENLAKNGYAVRAICADDGLVPGAAVAKIDIPEYVRYLLGVGGGRIADITRLASQKCGVGYGLAPTSPSTDGYIADSLRFSAGEGAKCTYPDFLLIDEEVVEGAPKRLVAAGYGRVIAQLVNIFDMEFMRTVYAAEFDGDALAALSRAIRSFEESKDEPLFNLRLLRLLNEIARLNARLHRGNGAADAYAHVLSECIGGRTEGETSFIAAYVVLNVYRMFLKEENLDTLLPADVVKTLKLLEKMRIINYNGYVSSMQTYGAAEYLKSRFVLSEYREELYGKLDGLDISALARFWRRLYDDAGFWLKNYANSGTLLRYLSISAELADNSLLKYLKRLGFLEKFI